MRWLSGAEGRTGDWLQVGTRDSGVMKMLRNWATVMAVQLQIYYESFFKRQKSYPYILRL